MRTTVLVALTFFSLASAAFAQGQPVVVPVVLDEVEYVGAGYPGTISGVVDLITARLQDLIAAIGLRYGVALADRENLPAARAEKALAQDPDFNPATAPASGQGVVGRAIISVKVLRCTFEESRERHSHGYGRSHTETDRLTGTVTVWLQATVIDLSTYMVIASAESKEYSTGLVYDRVYVAGWYGSDASVDEAEVKADMTDSALDRAVGKLLEQLLPQIRARLTPLPVATLAPAAPPQPVVLTTVTTSEAVEAAATTDGDTIIPVPETQGGTSMKPAAE